MNESKQYYSGKHQLYGYKTEVSVLHNGVDVLASLHYPAAASDLDMFRRSHGTSSKASAQKEVSTD